MMQWERKQIEEEKAKLQAEIESLKNQLEVTRILLRRDRKTLEKARHDRDRYKRRIDLLMVDRKGELPEFKEFKKKHENLILAYDNQLEWCKKFIDFLLNKKDG